MFVKNHENIGPVHILFDSPLVRRLSRRGRELSNADLPELLESYDEERDRGVWNSENRTIDAEGRQLQGSGALTTLTLSFKRCIFEVRTSSRHHPIVLKFLGIDMAFLQGNKLVGNFANTGMIQSVTAETILLFEDVIFRNNDYGDNTLKVCSQCVDVVCCSASSLGFVSSIIVIFVNRRQLPRFSAVAPSP